MCKEVVEIGLRLLPLSIGVAACGVAACGLVRWVESSVEVADARSSEFMNFSSRKP